MMIAWWSELSTLNQVFYGIAWFFSAIFLWQFVSSLLGLGGDDVADLDAGGDVGDLDLGPGPDVDDLEAGHADLADTDIAFRVLSVRSVVAFATLFSWAMALYLDEDTSVGMASLYASAWGIVAGLAVSWAVTKLRGLAESGSRKLSSCVGTIGRVYSDIYPGMIGEVRVSVRGVVSVVKARTSDNAELRAGTPVRVTRMFDKTTVEVQPATEVASGDGDQT